MTTPPSPAARLGPYGYGGGYGAVTTVRPTPLQPFAGPVVRTTAVGPLGGVSTTRTQVRATPLNPFVGPVVTQTTTSVRPTPLNPFVGPVVTRRTTVAPIGK